MPNFAPSQGRQKGDSKLQIEVSDLFCPKFNIGLEILFLQKKQLRYLAQTRFHLEQFIQKYPTRALKRGFKLEKTFFCGRRKHELKKLHKKTKLIEFYPDSTNPKWIQFKNESQVLKEMIKNERELSISQKIFTYSVAQDYRINRVSKEGEELPYPKTPEDWQSQTWTLITNQIVEGMGQEKLALLLNTDRGVVNQKLKHFATGLKIENRFVQIGKNLHSSNYNKESLKRAFKGSKLNGYFVDHQGNLYRQIANKYIITDFEERFEFSERRTFHYQNKRLNKIHSKKLDSLLPAEKEIATKRDARRKGIKELRNKLLNPDQRKRIGVKDNGLLNSQSISQMIYQDGKINFLYQKLQKEVITIKKLGIELSGRIDPKSFWLKSPIEIKEEQNFKKLTEDQFFNQWLQFNRRFKDFTEKEKEQGVWRKTRRDQRLSLQFSSGWGFM